MLSSIKKFFSWEKPNDNEKGEGSLLPKSADVVFYPDKIIVYTIDFTEGPGIISTKFSILSPDVEPEILGHTLKKHLNLSQHGLKIEDSKQAWENYKKAAGFKTNKETYQNSRLVSAFVHNSIITLTPTENNYNTGYNHCPDLNILVPYVSSNSELGTLVTKARNLSNG